MELSDATKRELLASCTEKELLNALEIPPFKEQRVCGMYFYLRPGWICLHADVSGMRYPTLFGEKDAHDVIKVMQDYLNMRA